jgi:hypothetical protein
MDINPAIGVGVGDLQHAMRAEVERILKEPNGGDPVAQTKLLYRRLQELDLLHDREVESLSKLTELSSEASNGKRSAQAAYFESRGHYNHMLASGNASPLALVLASSAIGSYTITEGGDGTVVIAKSADWEHRGAAAGAAIGSVWGPGGALIGGAVGGLVGAAVDECKK